MKASMLDSQLATLETPDPATETGGEQHIGIIHLGTGPDESEEVGMEGVVREASRIAESWVGSAPRNV